MTRVRVGAVLRPLVAAGLLALAAAETMHFGLKRKTIRAPRGERRVARALYEQQVPVYGNFREIAYYYADVWVGTPPQKVTVITDTGSTLMAFACTTCTSCGRHLDPPFDPTRSTTSQRCSSGTCTYTQSYTEGSRLTGHLYNDMVWLGGDDSPAADQSQYAINFQFGCHDSEGGLFYEQLADGIMGMGNSNRAFPVALWNAHKLDEFIFSMCLTLNGGALSVGGFDERLHVAPIAWTPLTSTSTFYTVDMRSVSIGGTKVPVSDGYYNSGGSGTIVDSGTTFTYVPTSAYNAIRTTLTTYCSTHGSTACVGTRVTIPDESLCWRLARASDINTFPTLTIALRGITESTISIDVRPQNYIINMDWDEGAYCLGIYDNGIGDGTVIGANSMLNHDVIFDLTNRRIGWTPSECIVPVGLPSPTPTPTPAATPSPSASSLPPSPSASASASPIPASDTPAASPSASEPSASASASPTSAAVVVPSSAPTVGASATPSNSIAPPVLISNSPAPSMDATVVTATPSASTAATDAPESFNQGALVGASVTAGIALLCVAVGVLLGADCRLGPIRIVLGPSAKRGIPPAAGAAGAAGPVSYAPVTEDDPDGADLDEDRNEDLDLTPGLEDAAANPSRSTRGKHAAKATRSSRPSSGAGAGAGASTSAVSARAAKPTASGTGKATRATAAPSATTSAAPRGGRPTSSTITKTPSRPSGSRVATTGSVNAPASASRDTSRLVGADSLEGSASAAASTLVDDEDEDLEDPDDEYHAGDHTLGGDDDDDDDDDEGEGEGDGHEEEPDTTIEVRSGRSPQRSP